MLTDEEVFAATRNCIEMWNTLDVEKTLSSYTDDVSYFDPGVKGHIRGKDELRRYLTRFFRVWEMQFRVLEDRRLAGMDGQVCLWEVDVRRVGGDKKVTVRGMDLIEVRGNQLCRDEAFMDRQALQELLPR
jgi:ketosteroid isomerase-like protein